MKGLWHFPLGLQTTSSTKGGIPASPRGYSGASRKRPQAINMRRKSEGFVVWRFIKGLNSICPRCIFKQMTLHEAIERLLMLTGRSMTTREIAKALNEYRWYIKKDKSVITPFQIHGRTKNYPRLFNRQGSLVSLARQNVAASSKTISNPTRTKKPDHSGLNNSGMKHSVRFSIPERELGNANIEFDVKKNGKKFGTLKISKGSVVWVPEDNSYGYKLNWLKFDGLMTKEGKRERR